MMGVGGQTLTVSRSSQVADRLFTGSSQRRLNTQNLQEHLRMERYATSIDRAKKSTEHDHAFQKKIFIQKSERLNEAKEQLKLRSEREQEAAREAEQLAQLNREQLVELMKRLAATQEEVIVVGDEPNKMVAPPRGGPVKDDPALTKVLGVPLYRKSSGTSGPPTPRSQVSKGSEISLDGSLGGSQTSWRPSWDQVEPREEDGSSPVKSRSGKVSVLDRPSASSLVQPGSSPDQSPRRKSSARSSVHSSPRRVSDSRVALSRPPLSRRISAASFASSKAASSAAGRSDGKRSRSTGDAPVVSSLGNLSRKSSQQQFETLSRRSSHQQFDTLSRKNSQQQFDNLSRKNSQQQFENLSRRSSQQQLDLGDIQRLTRRLSNVKTDHLSDPNLMLEEERKVYEFLQKTQPGAEAESQRDTNTVNFYRKAKPRMSVVYTGNAEKQLAQIFGSEVVEDLHSNNNTAEPQDTEAQSDEFLERISQIPISLPAVYLTQPRSAPVRPRNFDKEIESRKAALPVYNQFENLRYCRYLRIPMPFEKEGEGEEEGDESKERQFKRRATRMAPRTVSASSKRLTTNYSLTSEMAQKVEESTGSDAEASAASPLGNLHHSEQDHE